MTTINDQTHTSVGATVFHGKQCQILQQFGKIPWLAAANCPNIRTTASTIEKVGSAVIGAVPNAVYTECPISKVKMHCTVLSAVTKLV